MRAIVQETYGGTDRLELRDVPIPTPGKGEVRVRVHAAAVDRGTWHVMTGLPRIARLGLGLRRPRQSTPGSDVAGVVDAVGPGVTRLKAGDEVFGACSGSFADYVCTKESRLVAKPASLTFEAAAAIPMSALAALHGLRDSGRLTSGQRVLITGASGGVGTYAVQLAKAFGAHVTAVASTSKLDLVRSLGADEVIDYTRTEFAVMPGSFDLILDIAGNRPLAQLRRLLTSRGTLVIAGGEGGGSWFGGLHRQLGAVLLSPFIRQRLTFYLSLPKLADLETLAQLAADGAIRPAIDRAYALEEAPKAIDYLTDGHVRGKVVIAVAG